MSLGIYNETYFKNNPEEKSVPGILYCVVLVNKTTFARECIKIGITKGTSTKAIIKRAAGFKGYEIRIQRTYQDTLYKVWQVEQDLHKKFSDKRYTTPSNKFGGHTELFIYDEEIIKSVPARKK